MTTTINPTSITAVQCPSWCTVDHTDMPPGAGFHGGPSIDVGTNLGRLWLTDQEGARPGVVIGGQCLPEGEVHELGMALVRAADILRRERQQAEQTTGATR